MSWFNLFDIIINHDVITDMLWTINDFIYSLHDRYIIDMNAESNVMINDSPLIIHVRFYIHIYDISIM